MKTASLLCLTILSFLLPHTAQAQRKNQFDWAVFSSNGSDRYFDTDMFNTLNWNNTGGTGKMLVVASDSHKTDILAMNNSQAMVYTGSNLSDDYLNSGRTGAQEADTIQTWANNNFASAPPQWIILDEISSALWSGDDTYRNWFRNVAQRLNQTYSHLVVSLAPWQNVSGSANSAQWQSLATYSYIAPECYLSGEEVKTNGYSVSYCQTQYQTSLNSYNTAKGIPMNRLFIAEHYGSSLAGTGWGRSGLSIANWRTVCDVRCQGAHNVAAAGYVSYGWYINAQVQPIATFKADQIDIMSNHYKIYSLP